MKVVMASNNAHKIAELRAILSAYGLDVVSQREAGVHVEPEETGTTFEENSRIKAVAVMQACGLPAVADDSGLMVDALNGEPGVYSARYGGPDCISDSDRINYLLKKLENGAPVKTVRVAADDQISMTNLENDSLRKRLEQLSVETMTPIEAMNALFELKKMI